jgi:predicted amidohydrolase YtcJ
VLTNFADTILTNGKIVTADATFRVAEAIAVSRDRFVAVGTNAEIEALAGADTKRIDLCGRTVLPGLIDTHAHIAGAGDIGQSVSFAGVTNVPEALRRIADFAAKTPSGCWITGDRSWAPATQLHEHRFLTAAEIDTAAPGHPVFLPAGGHFAMTNTAGLRAAGITKASVPPDGGVIERDANGDPTGVLQETAIDLVRRLLPPLTLAERVVRMKRAMQHFNSFGITSLVEGLTDPAQFRVFEQLWAEGTMTVRMTPMFMPAGSASTTSVADWEKTFSSLGVQSGFGDDWLRFAGIGEILSDGGMTLRTAYLRDAYPDDPCDHGALIVPPGKMGEIAEICGRYGWRVAMHAVGDGAVDRVLDAYEYANERDPISGKRWMIIHGSLIQGDQLKRAKALGVRVEMQNVFMWDKAPTVARFVGAERAGRAIPTRLMIDTLGIANVGAGTDYPVNTLNPFINLYIMITRRDPSGTVYGADQAITREEAVRLYTSSAAHATFDEQTKGTIEPGRLADLILLSDDLLTVPDEQIKDITVLLTMVGGNVVYERT